MQYPFRKISVNWARWGAEIITKGLNPAKSGDRRKVSCYND